MTLNLTDEERLHYQVMQACLNAIQKEKPLILKGGTALMLGYGLERFSEDLDFDIADTYTGKGTIKLDNVLKNALPFGISLQELVLRKETPSVTRYILRYQKDDISDKLKIEVSYRTPVKAADIMQKNGNQFLSIVKIADFKLNTVLDQHSEARTRARDLFDAAFIIKNYANEVNPALLDKLKQIDINELVSRYEESFVEDRIMQRHGISADEVVLSLVEHLNNTQTQSLSPLQQVKETYKEKIKTLSGADKVRLKIYQDTASIMIAKQEEQKRPAKWLHFYQYVADKIQDGKLNLSKPIPNHQLTQIINQYAEQKQSSKPSQTPNTPKKHKR